MLKLASTEILVTFVVYSKAIIWNCYEDYKECVAGSNKTDHVHADNVESHNLVEFCSDHTQNIFPCLVTKFGLTKSMSASMFSLFLAVCEAGTQNNKSAITEVQQILKHLARLYAYFCAYSNIIDLHRNRECFQYLMKRCVMNIPDDSCMFYHCGKIHFNLSESSQEILFTRQHDTTKTVNLDHQLNQLANIKNHQARTTTVVTIILAFIDMIQ